jgi:hypothetical protein
MPKAAKTPFRSSLSFLLEIKRKFQDFAPQDVDLYEQLIDLYGSDLRAVIDGVVGKTPAERKAYLAPYTVINNRIKKYNLKRWCPPPGLQMQQVAAAFPVVLGWMKNRHKYQDGELNPPASAEMLRTLQDLLKKSTAPPKGSMLEREGRTGADLPTGFVDSYLICDGMSGNVRLGGTHFLPIESILEQYHALLERDKKSLLPFGDDGAGNFYVMVGNEVYNLNHEGNELWPLYPSLGTFLTKACEVTR